MSGSLVSGLGRRGRGAPLTGAAKMAAWIVLAGASLAASAGGLVARDTSAILLSALVCHMAVLRLQLWTDGMLPDRLRFVRTTLGYPLLLLQVLVVAYVLTGTGTSSRDGLPVILTLLLHQGFLLMHELTAAGVCELARPRVATRNLGMSPDDEASAPGSRRLGTAVRGHSGILFACALSWPLGDPVVNVTGAAVLGAGLHAVGTLLQARRARQLLRATRGDALVRAANDAVAIREPLVILYYGGGPDSTYAVNMWLDTMHRMHRAVVVLLRDPAVLGRLAPTTLPVVCLADPLDVQRFMLPSAKVALYVTNGTENLRLLRNPALRTAFIAHGDSDKEASTNPFCKVYDELWVAGEAGRDRYLAAGVGIRPEQIRLVGRPQTSRVHRSRARVVRHEAVVLYAPTWEGWYARDDATSVGEMGIAIAQQLAASGVRRVGYRPHPLTGSRRKELAAASRQIATALSDAGLLVEDERFSGDVYDALNHADVLITDVSALISDFLPSGKPYLVTTGAGLSEEEFRRRFPSTAAAHLVGPGAAGLAEALDDVFAQDSLREARWRLRDWLLGPETPDPYARFAAAVDTLARLAEPVPTASPSP